MIFSVPTTTTNEPDGESLPKFEFTDFDELVFNAVVAESFSVLHLKGCVPYFANQQRKSLLFDGVNLCTILPFLFGR